MNLDCIRNLFSKAAILVTNAGIVARYMYKGRWFTQDIEDKSGFLDLLNESESFGINISEKTIDLVFQNHSLRNGVYYPIKPEISKEELDGLLKSSYIECINNDGFFEFMNGVNISDRKGLAKAVREWSDIEDSKFINMNLYSKWQTVIGLSRDFQKWFPAEVETYKPDDGIGIVEIQIPERFIGILRDDASVIFRQIVNISSEISLEGNVDDGFLNIVVGVL